MDDVGRRLEDQGVDGFHRSFADLLITLRGKAHQLAQQ
jgi:transaldolase